MHVYFNFFSSFFHEKEIVKLYLKPLKKHLIQKKKKKNSANSDLLITFTLYSFNNSDLQIKAVLTPITADPHPTI
jgi:hypothetical protein